MNHTPGPWFAQKYPDVKNWTVSAHASIASVKTGEADARLIASAPDMANELAALKARVRELEKDKARLDWLCSPDGFVVIRTLRTREDERRPIQLTHVDGDLREAIDAAMQNNT